MLVSNSNVLLLLVVRMLTVRRFYLTAGANIGLFALYAARYVQQTHQAGAPPLHLLAVEPMRANYSLLQRNLQLHEVCHEAYRCAVGCGMHSTSGGACGTVERLLDSLSGDAGSVTSNFLPTVPKVSRC